MFDALFILSIIGSFVDAIKENNAKTIPIENWGNKDLYYEDLQNGISIEQRMKNLENGKYKAIESHPEPHRDLNGKIIIENSLLYNKDLEIYGAEKTMKWVKQGKYNLSAEALEKENIEFVQAEVQMIPTTYVELDEKGTEKMQRLIDSLEDLDDVMDVYHNWDE